MAREPVVALGLLTREDLNLLGSSFHRLWPVDEVPSSFDQLLDAIDEAEAQLKAGATKIPKSR